MPNERLLIVLAAFALAAGQAAAAEPRYLIVHADDAGMSHSVNLATIEAMERGIVTSASIMVPCPWFPEFAEYAAAHPEKDFGIHLTLNCEWERYRWGPVAPREKVPSLVDERGYLWDNVRQVAANVKAEEAEIELRAQIDRAREFGIRLSHLDTHMGAVFARPDITRVYVKLGKEYDLPVLFVRPRDDNTFAERYPDAMPLLADLDAKRLAVLDALYQFYDRRPHDERTKIYLDTIRELRPGVSQIIIHCGLENAELTAITSSVTIRDGDRRIFTAPETEQVIKDAGVVLITWGQFQEMTREAGDSP